MVEASCGLTAIEKLTADPQCCDLVVTDYAMPSLSGIEMVRRLRELRGNLPAIIITGYADTDSIQNRPADVTVLNKPFTPDRLAAAIGQILPAEKIPDQALSRAD